MRVSTILFLMMLAVFAANAQTTINVSTYGAVGDATNVYVWPASGQIKFSGQMGMQ